MISVIIKKLYGRELISAMENMEADLKEPPRFRIAFEKFLQEFFGFVTVNEIVQADPHPPADQMIFFKRFSFDPTTDLSHDGLPAVDVDGNPIFSKAG